MESLFPGIFKNRPTSIQLEFLRYFLKKWRLIANDINPFMEIRQRDPSLENLVKLYEVVKSRNKSYF